MSRIGKLPIYLKDIEANISGSVVTLQKGNEKIEYDFGNKVKVILEEKKDEDDKSRSGRYLKVVKINPSDKVANFLGLHRSNLNNIVKGLLEDYEITLEYSGVGYKANISDKFLVLSLGYSHDIAYIIPKGINIKTAKPNLIIISGKDKQKVGQIASEIINFRTTEPYKGKGIKKKGAWILRKEGKKK
jgi:large subunit ribosomal protein L6